MRNFEKWENDDWKRWYHDRVYERLKRRDNATCVYGDHGRYGYHGGGDSDRGTDGCLCEDNIAK